MKKLLKTISMFCLLCLFIFSHSFAGNLDENFGEYLDENGNQITIEEIFVWYKTLDGKHAEVMMKMINDEGTVKINGVQYEAILYYTSFNNERHILFSKEWTFGRTLEGSSRIKMDAYQKTVDLPDF